MVRNYYFRNSGKAENILTLSLYIKTIIQIKRLISNNVVIVFDKRWLLWLEIEHKISCFF